MPAGKFGSTEFWIFNRLLSWDIANAHNYCIRSFAFGGLRKSTDFRSSTGAGISKDNGYLDWRSGRYFNR
jgi:hypothetical protein